MTDFRPVAPRGPLRRRGYSVLPTREEMARSAALPTLQEAEALTLRTELGTLDVVWIAGPWEQNEPLRHSMRTVARHVPFRRAWVAGYAPGFVNRDVVGLVEVPQEGTKHENSTANLYAACQDPEISDPFIWLHDDMFAMRPVTVLPLVDKGPMQRFAERLRSKYQRDYPYLTGMEATQDLLRRHGIPDPISYEVHVPIVVYKEAMLAAIELAREAGVVAPHKRSIYGNMTFKPEQSVTVDDPKIAFSAVPSHEPETWLSTSTTSWAGYTGRRIRKEFHARSGLETTEG